MDGRLVRVGVLAEDKDGFRLESAEALKLPEEAGPDDADAVGKLLAQRLAGQASGRRWVACELPTSGVIQRMIALPEGSPEELAQMVRFQLERELPLPASSASFDTTVLGTRRAGMQMVLLAAVRKELLRGRESLIKAGGFQPRLCTINAHAAFISCAPVFERSPEEVKCLVLLRDSQAEVVFGKRRDILFARSLDVGLRGPGEAGALSQEELLRELTRSMDAFRVEWREEEVAGLVLTGSNARLPGLSARLKEQLRLPVEICDPLLRKGLVTLPPAEGRDGCEFAVALGVSLATLEPHRQAIDFWHPRTGEAPAVLLTPARKLALAGSGLVAMLLLGALLALQVQRSTLAGLNGKLLQVGSENRQVKAAREKLDLLKPWSKSGKTSLEVLRQISILFPPQGVAYLTKLDIFESTGAVRMEGRASKGSDIYDLIIRMNESEYFENTRLFSEKTDPRLESFPYEFTLTTEVVGTQGAK
jgi:Tfp pilus assembly PilM family ATPase